MGRSPLFFRLVCAAFFAVAAARAQAQSVAQDLQNFVTYSDTYNLITFGNTTLGGSSDTQGGIAVGGNLSLGGSWTIASQVSADPNPSLYVAGQLTLNGTSMQNNGYASLPGLNPNDWTWNSSQKELTGSDGTLEMNSSDSRASTNPIDNPIPSGWNWTTEQNEYDSISTSLARASTNGTISVSGGNLDFNTTVTSGVAVFDLDAADLSGNSYNGNSFSNIQISVPTGVDYVINVTNLASGQTLFGSGANFNSGSNDNQLLWNFEGPSEGTGSVTISDGGNFYGSVLAPKVSITDDTTVDGQVVADSFDDCGVELHDSDFSDVLVPEPSAFAIGVLALCAAAVVPAVISRRRAAARAQARAALVPLANSVSK
jgi:choice-of-anchor A domain-containing protein